VTAAIVLWNTVYLERATNALRCHGQPLDDALLRYLSPLGWEHINLNGGLPVAQQFKDQGGEVQAVAAAASGLAVL